jgi:sec-independent protein translocase protein TatA
MAIGLRAQGFEYQITLGHKPARRNTMELFQPTHLLIIAVVVIILFGGRKLPELGKGLGEGLRSFKDGMKGVTDDPKDAKTEAHAVTPKPGDDIKPPTA